MRVVPKCLGLALGAILTVGVVAACEGTRSWEGGPAPVRIGGLIPVTGLDLPNYLAAFRASVRDLNAHGGIHGRPVVVDNCDDRSDPNQAQVCARRLIEDHVIATAGNLTSFGMVEAPILDEAGIPQVGTVALSPEESTLPTSFPLDGGLGEQLDGAILDMKRRGLHSLFVAVFDEPTGIVADQSIRTFAKAAGLTYAGDAVIPAAATSFASYVQQAIQSKADVMVPALPSLPTLAFLAASNQAGARYKIAYPGGELRPDQIRMLGGAQGILNGALEFETIPPLSARDQFPALRTFKEDLDAEYAAGDRSASPELRTPGTLTVWLAVQIIGRLASQLPTVDAASLLRALRTRPTVDTLGLTTPWTPGKNGPPPFVRNTNQSGYFVTQRNGEEVLEDPNPTNPLQAVRVSG
jgi:ABC-type branched-subunit amino acid transport system substrate-binding protein